MPMIIFLFLFQMPNLPVVHASGYQFLAPLDEMPKGKISMLLAFTF